MEWTESCATSGGMGECAFLDNAAENFKEGRPHPCVWNGRAADWTRPQHQRGAASSRFDRSHHDVPWQTSNRGRGTQTKPNWNNILAPKRPTTYNLQQTGLDHLSQGDRLSLGFFLALRPFFIAAASRWGSDAVFIRVSHPNKARLRSIRLTDRSTGLLPRSMWAFFDRPGPDVS